MFTRQVFKSLIETVCTSTFINRSYSTIIRTKRTRCGTKAGKNVLRSIQPIISSFRDISNRHSAGINHGNLIRLKTEVPLNIPTLIRHRSEETLLTRSVNVSNLVYPLKSYNVNSTDQLLLTLLNARSVSTKHWP